MMKIAAILTSAAIACAPVACPVQENFAARCAAARIDCVQNVCMPCPTQNACSGYDDLFDAPAQGPSESQQPDDSGSESARLNEYARQVIDLVNQERAAAGLADLKTDAALCAAAQVRAQEIAQSFSHTRPDGTKGFTVLKERGIVYVACGENIAKDSITPRRVMEGWMNSAGHRKNILNANFTSIGVGYYLDAAGTAHWVQLFTA